MKLVDKKSVYLLGNNSFFYLSCISFITSIFLAIFSICDIISFVTDASHADTDDERITGQKVRCLRKPRELLKQSHPGFCCYLFVPLILSYREI